MSIATPLVMLDTYATTVGYVHRHRRLQADSPVFRNETDQADDLDTYELPRAGFSQIQPADPICKSTQQVPDLKNALRVAPGSSILLQYNENGHITKPWKDPTKPSPGKVYIYGTDNPQANATLLSIHKVWQKSPFEGVHSYQGGGALLAQLDFDDGECYQYSDPADSPITEERQQSYGPGLGGGLEGQNRWCGNVFQLPLIMLKPSYTVYWVWDWPDQQGNPQVYTSCLDLNIA